jgi:pyruvate/2-oxoglutarate dehydrogenase complex dihydrolipoamide acyltransferase (E2) component
MVGVIREIHVAPGDAVAAGDRVITMEAMKMDIYVNAPAAGSVAAIHCRPGDTTSEGALLLTLAPGASAPGADAPGADAGAADAPEAGDAGAP